MNILIIRAGNIGDVLMATPLIRVVKQVFADAQVDFITSPQAYCVVQHNPYIRDIFIMKKNKNLIGKIKREWLRRQIKRRQFQMCFILEEHPQYKKFIHTSVFSSCARIGFSGKGEEFLTQKIKFSHEQHVIGNSLNLLKEYYPTDFTPEDFQMDFFLSPVANLTIQDKVSKFKKFVIIHPGTTEYLPYRSWLPERYAECITFLLKQNYTVVITGRLENKQMVDTILSGVESHWHTHIFSVLDETFENLAYMISKAELVVCSDTGVLHVAQAFRTPLVGLFGPSNPHHTGPVGVGKYEFIRNKFDCGPCNYSEEYRYEDKKNCLDGHAPECLKSITSEQVIACIKKLIPCKQ